MVENGEKVKREEISIGKMECLLSILGPFGFMR